MDLQWKLHVESVSMLTVCCALTVSVVHSLREVASQNSPPKSTAATAITAELLLQIHHLQQYISRQLLLDFKSPAVSNVSVSMHHLFFCVNKICAEVCRCLAYIYIYNSCK